MSFLQVKNNTELMAEEDAEYSALREAQERQNRPIITSLASYVRDCWQAAKESKIKIEKEMIDALRQKRACMVLKSLQRFWNRAVRNSL